MQRTIVVGNATYQIIRQFDSRKKPSQLIIEQLLRKDLPFEKSYRGIDSTTDPKV